MRFADAGDERVLAVVLAPMSPADPHRLGEWHRADLEVAEGTPNRYLSRLSLPAVRLDVTRRRLREADHAASAVLLRLAVESHAYFGGPSVFVAAS